MIDVKARISSSKLATPLIFGNLSMQDWKRQAFTSHPACINSQMAGKDRDRGRYTARSTAIRWMITEH